MSDKVLRDEIWESERFLDLPTDSCRVAYLRMLSQADDFGNLEGGLRRLFRMLQACTQIKTEAALGVSLEALIDADLIRCYKVDGRELIHLPRMRPHRQYIVRKMPGSPWDADITLGKTQRIEARGLAKSEEKQPLSKKSSNDVATTCHARSSDVAQGVGVGVGVGEKIDPTGLVPVASRQARIPPCPTEEIVKAFHAALPTLPGVVVLNASRKAAISARWREVVASEKMDQQAGLEWFAWFFGHVAKSRFLTGRTQSRDGRVWRASLDWLMKPQNFAKTVEGNYHKESV